MLRVLRQMGVLTLEGQSVPPVPAHGGLLANTLWRLAAPRRSRWRGATFEAIRATSVKIATGRNALADHSTADGVRFLNAASRGSRVPVTSLKRVTSVPTRCPAARQ
jgi:hypothetical protein